jgi:PAS domain S-box-containing protein
MLLELANFMHKVDKTSPSDFALIFKAMPGLYLLLSPDYVILDATDRYAKTANFRLDDVIGENILDLFPDNPDQYNVIAKYNLEVSLAHVLKHKETHSMPVIRFDIPLSEEQGGSLEKRFWSTTNSPILNSDGEVAYILHETRDITAPVLQDQVTQENAERLAMLSSAFNAVAWEYDIENDLLTWDSDLQPIFGYKPEEMEPGCASWDQRVHPDDFPSLQQSINKATKAGEKIWTGEYRFRRADGSYAHVLDQGYVIYNEQKQPVRTFGSIIDLSGSKRAENELKESDARFRHLLDHLPNMAWIADPKGKILYFNDNWYSFTGMQKGQTSSRASVVHPEDTADVITAWHEAMRSGRLYEIEYRMKDNIHGGYRYFMERGVPMYGSNGEVKLWVGTYTDIEDQKQSSINIRLKDYQLESILQLSPANICLLEGPDHICQYISPGVYRMYGNRTYIGKPARDIWPELIDMGFIDLLDQVYKNGDVAQLQEFRTMYDRFRDGRPQEAYFNFKYQPVTNYQGIIEGVLVSAIDITEITIGKRRAEIMANELKQRLSEIN